MVVETKCAGAKRRAGRRRRSQSDAQAPARDIVVFPTKSIVEEVVNLVCDEYPIWNRNAKDLKMERLSKER